MYVQLTIRDTRIDVQRDIHLDRGDIDFSAGPDRAWLNHRFVNHGGLADSEAAAIWLIDSPETAGLLAKTLDAVPRLVVGERAGWEVICITDGRLTRRADIGLDQAVLLLQALAAQNLLDYQAHVFGDEGADIADR